MHFLLHLLGSLKIAVPLLVAIASILAWGTITEARFGTEAAQRLVYGSWWFQTLLAFLALNLAIVALDRYPWKRKHIPFVLAHIGIILILIGGIIGARFGIEGQLVIPEGGSSDRLRLGQNVLVVQQLNPGIQHQIPLSFKTRPWIHEPNVSFHPPLEDRAVTLTVNRYYPDAELTEQIIGGGPDLNPAIQVALQEGSQKIESWLFARNPARMGLGWGPLQIFFVEPQTTQQLQAVLGGTEPKKEERGFLTLNLPQLNLQRSVLIPKKFGSSIPIEGTPYRITFKEYFSDLAMTDHGVINQSEEPNNPAIAFVLEGPEGQDPHLLFALHPEFESFHAAPHAIHADIQYTHPVSSALPPNALTFVLSPTGSLSAVWTGPAEEREVIPANPGETLKNPWGTTTIQLVQFFPKAQITPEVNNRSNSVKLEAIHLTAAEEDQTYSTWLVQGNLSRIDLNQDPLMVVFRRAEKILPVSFKLLDFRKIDYPGTQMAAGFESDVILTDPERGLTLARTISMNNPLKHRGYSFFQSSFLDGPVQTTVLQVRKDPGVPLVYTGFLIVVAGIAFMFILRPRQQ